MKPVSPEEVVQIGQRLYGRRKWIPRMATALGVNPSTVWRWAHGRMNIAPASSTAIRGVEAQHKMAKVLGKSG